MCYPFPTPSPQDVATARIHVLAPATSAVRGVVRDPSYYCPGCNARLGCVCEPPEVEDARRAAAYALGHERGLADGPESRPEAAAAARLDYSEEYLAGYDDACVPLVRDAARRAEARPAYAGLSESDLAAKRVASEAALWHAFASERSRMKPETVLAKALQSACFSVGSGASGFAVPSKLVGVREHQRALWALVREGYSPYERLDVDLGAAEGVRVTRGDEVLGEVQPKHVPWVRPLLAFGLRVHLLHVTGHETDGHTLGLNVVFGGVGRAVAALADALGGDGHSAGLRLVVPAPRASPSETPAARAALVAEAEAAEDATATEAAEADVVLWRDGRGRAHASLGGAEEARPRLPHVVRHSPTGLEWGYGGSGPSDLALSVLSAVAGPTEAERHYRAFVAEVVARLPQSGGVLRGARVRAWLDRQNARAGAAPSQGGRAAA